MTATARASHRSSSSSACRRRGAGSPLPRWPAARAGLRGVRRDDARPERVAPRGMRIPHDRHALRGRATAPHRAGRRSPSPRAVVADEHGVRPVSSAARPRAAPRAPSRALDAARSSRATVCPLHRNRVFTGGAPAGTGTASPGLDQLARARGVLVVRHRRDQHAPRAGRAAASARPAPRRRPVRGGPSSSDRRRPVRS